MMPSNWNEKLGFSWFKRKLKWKGDMITLKRIPAMYRTESPNRVVV